MIELMLTPNQNSKYEVGPEGNKRTEYEMIELGVPNHPPVALVHIDLFYRRENQVLYNMLLAGKSVRVQIAVVEVAGE
jgi:hypothetical protein